MQPIEDLASDGYCLADPGREYVVFLNDAKPFTLKLDGFGATAASPVVSALHGPMAARGNLEQRNGGTKTSGRLAGRPSRAACGAAAFLTMPPRGP